MVNLFPTIIYSCMMGMTLFALLDVFNRPKARQNLFLKGLLLLLATHIAGELFIYSGAYVYAPALAGAQFPFRVLLGPALYFYAHATMSSDKEINKRHIMLALSGPILVVLVMLPFIFMLSPSEKLALATPATRDPEHWQIAIATCIAATFIFIAFTALFLGMAFKLHHTHLRQLKERYSEIEQRSLAWFNTVLIIWGATWLMYAIEFSLGALGWPWFGSGVVLPILETIALTLFIHKALSQKVLSASEKGVPRKNQARVALLSDEKMQTIAVKLKRIMVEDKLYLQDSLSLNKLSAATSVTENHISETLSQYLKTNFFQFVNSFRIEEAKMALRDKNKLITTIALDAGFSSKSTFNAAFKKIVGQSPSAYRNHLLEEEPVE
ncbi:MULTISPECIES: helix-turn-helix transcriptional regulator [unclassified Pseudoalteromonas]|uniref:helix-turn-helix domain-containing protein n=1 Tax=unclassified Pseudoalteromonas TaxID=194690 RepID=UPI000C06D2D9|nr:MULTISPECIES: helix-turn-helix transcriptional regulator [unclassified Pseudoalteromonas]MDP2634920.1 helix-turn-helix transcriptional regulator [Pseudoalteromonas sp. 1_MG-2023]PHN89161.1 AraC family transcriptional regulator [Pseudoalteromonas sp. 3D05]